MANKESALNLYADEIFKMAASGLTAKDIAPKLGLPRKKVNAYIWRHKDNLKEYESSDTQSEEFLCDTEEVYSYQFDEKKEEIHINGLLSSVLKDFDRLESNNNQKERRNNYHYDAFEFESGSMGREDDGFKKMFEESSEPFQYALDHMTDLQKQTMFDRILKGKGFYQMARERGISEGSPHAIYSVAINNFKHYYQEAVQLIKHNSDHPDDIITTIPNKLSVDQVVLIRQYRREFKTKPEIAKILGVSQYLVDECIHVNPPIVTKCPSCGNSITQPLYGKMQKFCNDHCFQNWFYTTALKEDAKRITSTWSDEYITPAQKLAISYYSQLRIPHKRMTQILRIPRVRITAHLRANPNPYSVCMNCGTHIPPNPKNVAPQKYCSPNCRYEYRKRMGYSRIPGGLFMTEIYKILPFPWQLYLVFAMRKEMYSFPQIDEQAGLSSHKLRRIFMFDPPYLRNCMQCGKPIETKKVYQEFCSRKCRWKARDSGLYKGKPKPKPCSIIITRKAGIINANLTKPIELYGSVPLYTATILIPKSDKKTVEGIRSAVNSAIEKGKSSYKHFRHIYIKNCSEYPFHDGDTDDGFPLFKDYYFINAASRIQPEILDGDALPIESYELAQKEGSGRAMLYFFPFQDETRSGIGCELIAVQKYKNRDEYMKHPGITFPLFTSEYLRVLRTAPYPRGEMICGKMKI